MNNFIIYSMAIPEDIYELNKREYFVVGRENSGGRHYSATMSYEDCMKTFYEYCYFVERMGGGSVYLYEKYADDYEIIKQKHIY